MYTRFLVFADLHVDVMHDGVARAQAIARAAMAHKVDFMIQLGDIQYPESDFLRQYSPESLTLLQQKRPWSLGRDDEKLAVRALLQETDLPLYSVMGNHDLHACDKATMCRYWGMPAPHYTFCAGGVRFIVLDTNMIDTGDGIIDMGMGNLDQYPGKQLRYLDEPQLQWLQAVLQQAQEPCVLLSHASLAAPVTGIHRREDFFAALQRGGADKVCLALNGHSHIDGVTEACGVPFVDINSASYHYLGPEFAHVRYSEQLCRMYPRLPSTAPYGQALYAIVTVDETGITIEGTDSFFVGPTPQDLHLPAEENDYPPSACIRSRHYPLPARFAQK